MNKKENQKLNKLEKIIYYSFIIFILLFSFCNLVNGALIDGVIGAYDFTYSTKSLINSANNCNFVNGGSITPQGLLLNGVNEYVTCGDLTSSLPKTIIIYFNQTSLNLGSILNYGNASTGAYLNILVNTNSETNNLLIQDGTNQRTISNLSNKINKNVMVAFTQSSSTAFKSYLNYTLLDSGTIYGTTVRKTLYIGANNLLGNNPGNYFGGYIKYITIYNRELSLAELQTIYNNGTVWSYPLPPQYINFTANSDLNNSVYPYLRNYIFVNVTYNQLGFNHSEIRLYNNSFNLINNYISYNSENSYNTFTNLSVGTYYFNASVCDNDNLCLSTNTYKITISANILPTNVTIIKPDCYSQFTIQNISNTTIYFNWSESFDAENETIYYKLYLNKGLYNILVNSNIANTFYNYSFLNFGTGDYLTKVYSCDNVDCSESISNCTFNVCINNYVRVTKPCADSLRLIEYYDANACDLQYNFPVNNGTYEDCTTENTVNVKIQSDYFIIGFIMILIIICLFLGAFKHEIFFGMSALLFVLLASTFIYYGYDVILYIVSFFMVLVSAGMWVLVRHK